MSYDRIVLFPCHYYCRQGKKKRWQQGWHASEGEVLVGGDGEGGRITARTAM